MDRDSRSPHTVVATAIAVGVQHHRRDQLDASRTSSEGQSSAVALERARDEFGQNSVRSELLSQAARRALRRGLVARGDLGAVAEALAPFGGIASTPPATAPTSRQPSTNARVPIRSH